MKNFRFTIMSAVVSALFWLLEAGIHKFIFSEHTFEFIPSDANEIWMRIVIVAILLCFGVYADKQVKVILAKEAEKQKIFYATVSAAQHILNNLLNQVRLAFDEIDETKELDDKTRQYLEQSLAEGEELVTKLSSVTEFNEKSIKGSVSPK